MDGWKGREGKGTTRIEKKMVSEEDEMDKDERIDGNIANRK